MTDTRPFVCVHGHFYQPPRENPWLEAIELQDSAYPYHDWNQRITAECYAPNAVSRILDGEGRIRSIANNYARISFNFGPTLLAWLEAQDPEIYEAILRADVESREARSGHGNALAQAYSHMILPLADARDKRTQVHWGIEDFRRRFGRPPEGMWLPETAADTETLEILAEREVKFTILAPNQAHRVRRIGGRSWKDVGGGRIDPTRAYRARLPSGRPLALFFYDGPISRAVAFEGLLSNGEAFASRILSGRDGRRDWPELLHIATDGESYGHHHRHGEMALAFALHHLEASDQGVLTNYGEYLERHPPTHEVQIFENSSWSCVHGVERWRSDCGCNSGGRPGWNQAWRAPLRAALDWLRDTLRPVFQEKAAGLLADPWAARDDYVHVLLDRTEDNVTDFLGRHAGRALSDEERTRALKLLEMQRHAMLMYTSCGWFFDELSGIETVQVILYASAALQLAREAAGADLEEGFLARLEEAKSNIPENRDGRTIYEKLVRPARLDLEKVGAHWAVSSLFEEYGEDAEIYCYGVRSVDRREHELGRARFAAGRIRAASRITLEAADLCYAVLHTGEHNLTAATARDMGDEAYEAAVRQIGEAFGKGDFAEAATCMDHCLGSSPYSIRSLFRDEQRKVVASILRATVEGTEASYRQIFEHHAPLVRFLRDLGVPVPRALQAAARVVLENNLLQEFMAQDPDTEHIQQLLSEVAVYDFRLDDATLSFGMRRMLARVAREFHGHPGDAALMAKLEGLVDLAEGVPFEVDLWAVQNSFSSVLLAHRPDTAARASQGDAEAQAWLASFDRLAAKLRILVPPS